MPIKTQIKGVNRVRNSFRKFVSLNARQLDPTMKSWAQDVRAILKGTSYPPVPSGSKYVRTGRLANSWKVTKSKPGHYALENSAPYSGYVVGDDGEGGQTAVHKQNGWWQSTPIIQKEIPKLTAALSREIRQHMRGSF